MAIDPQLLQDDLVGSARVKLLGVLVGVNLVGTVVGADGQSGQPGGAYADGWVFPGFNDDGTPLRAVEGTGLAAITLHTRNEWGANAHNTARFPILTVLIYADVQRTPDGNPAAKDAELRCRLVAKAVDVAFHDAANRNHDWPNGVRVHSSKRADSGLSITDVPNGDGAVRGLMRYETATDW